MDVTDALTDELRGSRFMKTLRLEPADATPVWIMRQAGRYLPEYMSVRRTVTFMELCKRPELAAEVTLSAQQALGVDAAILFADLLPILEPMGMHLEYQQGEGPVIHNPVKTALEVDRVHEIGDVSVLGYVFDAVKLIRAQLPSNIPLIGFAGAPFTLASYIIEGSGSRNYATTKKLMYTDPVAWTELMQKLVNSLVKYLRAQIAAGCQVIQLFDSWAGCLSPHDYQTFAMPFTRAVIAGLPTGIPVINFLTGNPALLPLCAAAGGHVIGLDWRVDFSAGWDAVGPGRGVQGNLDPIVLLGSEDHLRSEAKRILTAAARRPGHVFNLGHGVLPETDPERVKMLVRYVHDQSAAMSTGN